MTGLAAALQERRDIFRESDIAGSRARLRSQGGRRNETDKDGDEPNEPER